MLPWKMNVLVTRAAYNSSNRCGSTHDGGEISLFACNRSTLLLPLVCICGERGEPLLLTRLATGSRSRSLLLLCTLGIVGEVKRCGGDKCRSTL